MNDVTCHYCASPATTLDHIVPRRLIRQLDLDLSHPIHVTNRVPCCLPCNQRKADSPSTCECPVCVQAWDDYHSLLSLIGHP